MPQSTVTPGRWTRNKRDIGVVLWAAFLGAALGSVIIFALVDPETLTLSWSQTWQLSRELGYSLGFLFLFCMTLFASALVAFMIRTGPRRGHAYRNPGQTQSSEND